MSSPGDPISLGASQAQSGTHGGGSHDSGDDETSDAAIAENEEPGLNRKGTSKEIPVIPSSHSPKGSNGDEQDADQRYGKKHHRPKSESIGLERTTQAISLSEASDSVEEPGNVESSANQAMSGLTDSINPKNEYLDPTPQTYGISQSPARAHTSGASPSREAAITAHDTSAASMAGQGSNVTNSDNKNMAQQKGPVYKDEDSKSEIRSIMDQFDSDGSGPGEEEVMSPRTEIASPMLQAAVQHPPRTSSLESIESASPRSLKSPGNTASVSSYTSDMGQLQKTPETDFHNRTNSIRSPVTLQSTRRSVIDANAPPSPPSSLSLPTALPPEPDPEPDLPFDFHRFLEQLRHRTADPVAKFLRSFLVEFGKKQWMVHEQVKIISDFLAFITNKMAQCEVWRGVSDAEFDNAKEGMEKLVMNRLYTQTFSPAIPSPAPVQEGKGKRNDLEKLLGPTRKGQHQEDIERDEILGQKVRIYGWVQEEHLDIPPVGESGRRFLTLAQQGTAFPILNVRN